MGFSSILRSTLTGAGLLVTAHGVFAQTTPEPVLQGGAVEVLARRVAASPSLATRQQLDIVPLQGQSGLTALAAESAGFFVGDNGGRSFTDTFALRGMVNTPLFGEPALAVYLDDIPLGSGFTFPTELTGFTSAELHRGPSSAMRFGRAGPAGVLLLSTPGATGEAGGEITLSYGDYDTRGARVTARSAASEAGDVYVAAGYRARDGYITNVQLDEDVDYRDARSALVRGRLRLSETVEISALITGVRARDGAQPLVPLGGPFFEVDRSAEGVTHVETLHAGVTAAVQTPIGRLTATTAYTDWELGPYSNTLDFGFAELENGSRLEQRIWSEEITLSSSRDVALPWHVGVFAADQETSGAFIRAFSGTTFEESAYEIDSRALAIFGQVSRALTDQVTLTAGLRAEGTRRDFDRQEVIPNPNAYSARHRSSALLPHLSIDYALDERTTLFGRVGAGYKPGGFSAFTGNRSLAPFGAERSRSLEAGITRRSSDRRIEATLRAYGYDIDGYQIERSFVTGAEADDYLVVNAPRARSLGGELELAWRPVAGLRVAVDAGVTHVTLRDFRDPYTGDIFDGERAPYVPEHDLSVRLDYEHPTGWFGGVNLAANGRTYYTESEDPTFAQGSYTLIGARAGWRNDTWGVTVTGANLTDKEYYSAITPGTFHGAPGAPRTWLVEASWAF